MSGCLLMRELADCRNGKITNRCFVAPYNLVEESINPGHISLTTEMHNWDQSKLDTACWFFCVIQLDSVRFLQQCDPCDCPVSMYSQLSGKRTPYVSRGCPLTRIIPISGHHRKIGWMSAYGRVKDSGTSI